VAMATIEPKRPLSPAIAVAVPTSFSGQFGWPAAGKIAARFGVAGEGNVNQGIEVSVAKAAPILAAGDGVVAFVGDDVANYGGLILIRHGGGWITAYGRAAQADVTRGQKVTRGQMIGRAGSGSAPQLFFQMRKNRIPVDPLKQLPAR
jgi:murein DD-endopeptidase MepM/ murein hydrolase activator NlpD